MASRRCRECKEIKGYGEFIIGKMMLSAFCKVCRELHKKVYGNGS
jgi:hypothetical protein